MYIFFCMFVIKYLQNIIQNGSSLHAHQLITFPYILIDSFIQLFNFGKCEGHKVVCYYCLNLHYLITNKIENILICL